MFEIGFPELLLVAIVGLLVIGPERLPEALRTLGLWLGRMRRSFLSVKAEIEKEIGMDEVKRQLHNESIMAEMKRIEAEVKKTAGTAKTSLDASVNSIDPKRAGAKPAAAEKPRVTADAAPAALPTDDTARSPADDSPSASPAAEQEPGAVDQARNG